MENKENDLLIFYHDLIENYSLVSGQKVVVGARRIPFIKHVGIIVIRGGIVYVMHNSPDKNTVLEPYLEFIKGRKFDYFIDTDLCYQLSSDQILERYYSIQEKYVEYNVITYNCYDFIDEMIEYSQESKSLSKSEKLTLVFLSVFVITGLLKRV